MHDLALQLETPRERLGIPKGTALWQGSRGRRPLAAGGRSPRLSREAPEKCGVLEF